MPQSPISFVCEERTYRNRKMANSAAVLHLILLLALRRRERERWRREYSVILSASLMCYAFHSVSNSALCQNELLMADRHSECVYEREERKGRERKRLDIFWNWSLGFVEGENVWPKTNFYICRFASRSKWNEPHWLAGCVRDMALKYINNNNNRSSGWPGRTTRLMLCCHFRY